MSKTPKTSVTEEKNGQGLWVTFKMIKMQLTWARFLQPTAVTYPLGVRLCLSVLDAGPSACLYGTCRGLINVHPLAAGWGWCDMGRGRTKVFSEWFIRCNSEALTLPTSKTLPGLKSMILNNSWALRQVSSQGKGPVGRIRLEFLHDEVRSFRLWMWRSWVLNGEMQKLLRAVRERLRSIIIFPTI